MSDKNYLDEAEVLVTTYVSSMPIGMLNQSQVSLGAKASSENSENQVNFSPLNYLQANAFSFEDSDGILFKSIDLAYKKSNLTDEISLATDAGLFSIERKRKKSSGKRYGGTVFYDNFSLRLGVNDYDDFTEFVPTLIYQNNHDNHSYTLEYTRQNALFYTYSFRAYKKQIVANHFSISDYMVFSNKTELWANITSNIFSNEDREFTAQFDWIFYKASAYRAQFTYNFALEGWYTSHSLQHNDFYSPSFADATQLRVDPQYVFSKYFGVRGKLGLGYSVVDVTSPYKYGMWLFGQPAKNLDYSLGCSESNAARVSFSEGYHYIECNAHLGYSW